MVRGVRGSVGVALLVVAGFVVPEAASAASMVKPSSTLVGASRVQEQTPVQSADTGNALPVGNGMSVATSPSVATGDVLGRGYEQVITHTGETIEIREPAARGGATLGTIGLQTPGNNQNDRYDPHDGKEKTTAFQVVAAGNQIFYAHTLYEKVVAGVGGTWYWNAKKRVVGKLVVSDAAKEVKVDAKDEREFPDGYYPTALDAVVFEGRTYVAVGLNNSGVRVIDAASPGLADHHIVHGDWRRGGAWPRDAVTAVKLFVDGGKLRLASGKYTYDHPALVVTDGLTGDKLWEANYRGTFDPWEYPTAITYGKIGGHNELIVGWFNEKNGRAFVSGLDPATGTWLEHRAHHSDATGKYSALRTYETSAGQSWLAATTGNFVDRSYEFSSMLLFSNENNPDDRLREWVLQSQVMSAGDVPYAVPGYHSLQLAVNNKTGAAVSAVLSSSSTVERGGWLNTELKGARPFPTVSLGSGELSPWFGQGVDSLQDDAYAFVTVKGQDGVATGKILVTNGTVSLEQVQTTGRFTLSLEKVGARDSLLGSWQVTVVPEDSSATVVSAPEVWAQRLTPAPKAGYVPPATPNEKDPTFPVYRFDVSGLTFTANSTTSTVVDAPTVTVQASNDGQSWTDLGITRSSAPVREDDGLYQAGDSQFYWQNRDHNSYAQFRLMVNGTPTAPITVADLPAPEPTTELQGLQVLAWDGAQMAPIQANGLDQGVLRVFLKDTTSGGVDTNDPQLGVWYDRVFYRDKDTKELITNLIDPAHPEQAVTVTPTAGAYHNADGMVNTASSETLAYVSTNGTRQRTIFAALHTAQTASEHAASDIVVSGRSTKVAGAEGNGLTGFNLYGVAKEILPVTVPTGNTPTIYTTTGTDLKILRETRAITGDAVLPLEREGSVLLTTTALHPNGTGAKLANTTGLLGASFTAPLISEGTPHLLTNIPTN